MKKCVECMNKYEENMKKYVRIEKKYVKNIYVFKESPIFKPLRPLLKIFKYILLPPPRYWDGTWKNFGLLRLYGDCGTWKKSELPLLYIYIYIWAPDFRRIPNSHSICRLWDLEEHRLKRGTSRHLFPSPP